MLVTGSQCRPSNLRARLEPTRAGLNSLGLVRKYQTRMEDTLAYYTKEIITTV